MASLKAEALAHHHDTHGVPLRSRLFGAIRLLNRAGSAVAPLANLPGNIRPLRRLMDRVAGITPNRPLPAFRRPNLVQWFRRHARSTEGTAPCGEVTFLADSFTTFTEPRIGRAAVELLEAAGWAVRLESRGCCGRASFSKGLLDDARQKAQSLATALVHSSQPGSPIVGCEPSCILTLRDEHRQLLPNDPDVRDVAGRVRQVEELLLEALDAGRLQLTESALSGRRILYHGHCHQKAEVGTAATVALLRRIPGVEVIELDAGCCGMAGSFGFESEHYDLSMAVGEDRLFPAIRAASPDALVAATGVSCRQQIRHGTRRVAWHPLELVRQSLPAS